MLRSRESPWPSFNPVRYFGMYVVFSIHFLTSSAKKWRQIFTDNRVIWPLNILLTYFQFWWLRFCNKFGPIEAHFEKVSQNYWKKIFRMHSQHLTRYNAWYDISLPPHQPLPKKTRFNIFGQRYYLIHRNGFFFGMKVIFIIRSHLTFSGKSRCSFYFQNKTGLFNWTGRFDQIEQRKCCQRNWIYSRLFNRCELLK